jgi:hypothetical protein
LEALKGGTFGTFGWEWRPRERVSVETVTAVKVDVTRSE